MTNEEQGSEYKKLSKMMGVRLHFVPAKTTWQCCKKLHESEPNSAYGDNTYHFTMYDAKTEGFEMLHSQKKDVRLGFGKRPSDFFLGDPFRYELLPESAPYIAEVLYH